MEEKIYTLNIRHTSPWKYEITIPEICVAKTAPTLDSALNITFRDIVKHFTTRYLILVFADSQERPQTDLEQQVAFEFEQLGIAPHVYTREHHLVFALSCPLTREQTAWLDEQKGKLFNWYYTKDEIDVRLDEL